MDFIISADLGQAQDPTSIIAAGRTPVAKEAPKIPAFDPAKPVRVIEEGPADDWDYHIVYVQCLPLGTPYPDAVSRTSRIFHYPPFAGRQNLVCDRTGVGRVVMDMIRECEGLGARTWGVTYTGGKNESRDKKSPMDFSVPKKDLVGGLQLALQRGRVHARDGIPEGEKLKHQLLAFQSDKKASGYTAFEGQGKEPDDLVVALAMLVWIANLLPYEGEGNDAPLPAPPAPWDGAVTISPGMQKQHRPAPSWRQGKGPGAGTTGADPWREGRR